MASDSFVGGLSIPQCSDDALLILQDARKDDFDFITTNLPHSSALNRRDVTLIQSKWWSTSIVGSVTTPSHTSYYKDDGDGDGDIDINGDNDSETAMETSENEFDFGQNLVSALSDRDPSKRKLAIEHFQYMLDWTAHMNIPAAILPPIPTNNDDYIHYARFLATQVLKSGANNVQLWIRVDFNRESVERFQRVHRLCDGAANLGCILVFQSNMAKIQLKTKIEGNSTSASAQSQSQSQSEDNAMCMAEAMTLMHQLVGSNLRAVAFQTDMFLTNKRGFPTLSKAMQIVFIELLKRIGRTCRVMVEGMPIHEQNQDETSMGHSGMLLYLQYLRHLRSKDEVKGVLDTEEAKMETSYLDHLQSALQPLGDNLEFSTYEVFEKDPVKYERYQAAVELALADKIKLRQLRTDVVPGTNNTIVHVTIFVVGAGRGPLVNASLRAVAKINKNSRQINVSQHFNVQPRIIAVEKNPSAILFLNSLKTHDPKWKDVEVVECDMRCADKNVSLAGIIGGDDSHKADIVVSELLGSFGDNELSPECLDGFQQSGLMKESGVSIPQSYTSFLAPVTSMRLHSEAHAQAFLPANSMEGPGGKPCGVLQAMETPYVVRTHAASQLHKELPCWEFSHPVRKDGLGICEASMDVDNERSAQAVFVIDKDNGIEYGSGYLEYSSRVKSLVLPSMMDGDETFIKGNTVHGFLGTFHCVLYESITEAVVDKKSSIISIAPSTFSVGMFSWFPLYFPLREPQFAPPGSRIICNMWRRCDEDRVWYEWCSEVLLDRKSVAVSNMHNPNGRSCFVRL